ncbi:glutathione S-transferase [Pokkaliibacter plantistimulans]|uniref:Glutathione S-transferase n=1 Tax=Pokkaliibacter plantistimulans TaxID=1635171 RepID=A0ABX5LVU6_9GAMM|nr:glutathione S-transferase [Pokkaliibacter plantistimulans]PXF30299.1 glutathione S-transferase [Pokkaliibacter plantistimulans]
MSHPALTLYHFPLSGHSHRAELMLSLLGLPFKRVLVNLAAGEHKQPAFLELNSFGQVPVLDDNGTVIADSNAILVYLAQRYGDESWLPRSAQAQAAVQRWLSVAAGQVAYGPCAARLITVFGSPFNAAEVIARAHQILTIMDAELSQRAFLVGEQPTIADVACYTYIAHAPEGNVSLDSYPHVRHWLQRIEALPGFIAMPQTAVGLRA